MSCLAEANTHIERLIATVTEQQARIEALEAALFEIIMESNETYQCRAIVAVQEIARAALDKDAET
jgi:hypothetical protein